MRIAPVLIGGLLIFSLHAVPQAQAQLLILDYVGFDYEDLDPDPSQFGELGSGYQGLGLVAQVFAPLVSDTASFQYTYQITGLTSASQIPAGPYQVITYTTPGAFNVFEDSRSTGTDADFGTNPPSAEAPPTFVDGTLYLTGVLRNFRIVYDPINGTGSFEAEFEATGGSHLGDIPPNQRTGWTFSGATRNALNIPEGYYHQIDGQVFVEQQTASTRSSWGRVKAIYR